jgi:hypothetical protein
MQKKILQNKNAKGSFVYLLFWQRKEKKFVFAIFLASLFDIIAEV